MRAAPLAASMGSKDGQLDLPPGALSIQPCLKKTPRTGSMPWFKGSSYLSGHNGIRTSGLIDVKQRGINVAVSRPSSPLPAAPKPARRRSPSYR